jgi:hypothetical protein
MSCRRKRIDPHPTAGLVYRSVHQEMNGKDEFKWEHSRQIAYILTYSIPPQLIRMGVKGGAATGTTCTGAACGAATGTGTGTTCTGAACGKATGTGTGTGAGPLLCDISMPEILALSTYVETK